MAFVYIVRCADGTLYTGYARDPAQRERAHNTPGKGGARYTAGRRPVRLVYIEKCRSIGAALRREHQLKAWRRDEKEALIARRTRPVILKPVSRDRGIPAGELIEDVYAELRRLAARYVRRERANSVQATELVHEVYLRLLKDKSPQWQDRTHFLAIAAIAMRRLLVERARARGASKRGGGHINVTLDESLLAGAVAADDAAVDVVDLDRAMTALAALDAQQARIVELRYFGGLSVDEVADALSISPATVKRHWTIAKAWLRRELQ